MSLRCYDIVGRVAPFGCAVVKVRAMPTKILSRHKDSHCKKQSLIVFTNRQHFDEGERGELGIRNNDTM